MPVDLVSVIPTMNNNNPNYVQRHGDNFFNGKISVPNYPALRPQVMCLYFIVDLNPGF